MAKKKRNKKMSQSKRAMLTTNLKSTQSLSSLSPTSQNTSQSSTRSVKIHIPRKPR